MSSSLVRSTYRRMMKYFLRHWCMEIKCDGNSTTRGSTKKNGQDGSQKSDEHDKQSSNNKNNNCQMTNANLDKRIDDDGILLDAQLEWEHEEGKKERVLKKIKTDKYHKEFSRKKICKTGFLFYLGIEHSPKIYRKSEQDLLDIILTQSPRSTSSTIYIRAPLCPDFEWDHLFDFAL